MAVESTRLPGEFHKDPADRMIMALARTLSANLVTADEKIRAYKHVKTVWWVGYKVPMYRVGIMLLSGYNWLLTLNTKCHTQLHQPQK